MEYGFLHEVSISEHFIGFISPQLPGDATDVQYDRK